MSEFGFHKEMIAHVADALGTKLLEQVVFVGGCITGLLLTDDFTREQVRHTDDVDLIVNVLTQSELSKFESLLRERGFTNSTTEDAHIGSWTLGELLVDIIPVNPELLTSADGWCKEAYNNSQSITIDGHEIKLAKPIYFIAMKLEAYNDRGQNDPLESRDIEDVLNLFDGRKEIVDELKDAPNKLRKFVANEIKELFKNDYFIYAINSTAQSDRGREKLIIERLESAMEI